ncbi:hypothetical protein ACI65C_008985 [Semiaphis heraclei]
MHDIGKWVAEFSIKTNTRWNVRTTVPNGKYIQCKKNYICLHSSHHKVDRTLNKKGQSKNTDCKASIKIVVKVDTVSTRKSDPFVKNTIQRLKRDLKENKCTQPERANARMNSNNEHQIVTISDSDDDLIIITETSKTENENIIDLIDSDEDTQNLRVKYKPGPKSKTNVSIPNLKINDNDKVLPINTEASKSLSNGEFTTIRKRKPGPKSKTNYYIPNLKINDNDKVLPINTEASKSLGNGESTTLRKRKPGPKSKTMYVDDIDLETKETVQKKKLLNKFDVISNKESN